MNNSEIDDRNSKVHFLIITAPNCEPHLVVSLPKEPAIHGGMQKTYAKAHTLSGGLLTAATVLRTVVIHGTDVTTYTPETFAWLAGVGPDPFKQDPNWLGVAR